MNHRKRTPLYYWLDKYQEIDCLIETGSNEFISLEIKSAKTYNSEFRKSIAYLKHIFAGSNNQSFVVYAGDQDQILDDKLELVSANNLKK